MGKVQGMAAPEQLMAAIFPSQGWGQQVLLTSEEPARQQLLHCASSFEETWF